MDANGDIFGVTYWGGGTENGTVFELQHSAGGWTERILHKFSGKQDAANPSTGVEGYRLPRPSSLELLLRGDRRASEPSTKSRRDRLSPSQVNRKRKIASPRGRL